MSYIFNIFKEFKYSLMLIYFYVFVGQILFLLEPYVLGKMIDGLLIHEYWWLFVFLTIESASICFTYKRMVFDTKIYTDIYNKMIFLYLKEHKNSDPSIKIARTDIAGNLINFLESDIQYYIMALMSLIGTLCFIFLQDIKTGLVVGCCVLPITLVVSYLYRKIAQATRVGNNHYEQKVDILTRNEDEEIETFFKRRRKVLISGSTLQGKNWTALNSIKTIFLILALVVFTSNNTKLTQGEAVSMYSYINQFLISLMSIPIAVETFTRIKDVIHRIKVPLNNKI